QDQRHHRPHDLRAARMPARVPDRYQRQYQQYDGDHGDPRESRHVPSEDGHAPVEARRVDRHQSVCAVSQAVAAHSLTSALNAAGRSRLLTWPAPRITSSRLPETSVCIRSDSPRGAIVSSSPTTNIVGTVIVASVSLESGRAI